MTDTEINEAVARKLGFPIMDGGSNSAVICEGFDKGKTVRPIPDYCHSIAAAWEIVEHVRKIEGSDFDIVIGKCEPFGKKVFCQFSLWDKTRYSVPKTEKADTAPMAICLAFLKLEGK